MSWLAAFLATALAAQPVVIEVYQRDGCPHCADADVWLDEFDAARDDVSVTRHDVEDPEALHRLQALSASVGLERSGVPTFVVGDQVIVGFDASTPPWIASLVDAAADPGGAASPASRGEVVVPWLGTLRPARLGLPAFTVIVGLLDGFNPCATWVLLFLLSILVNLRDRFRMALIAGTFVVVSGLAYYAFMAAWLNVFLFVGLSRTVQVVLGLVALVMGAIHIKDFFAFKKGVTLSIPESARPGIAARAKGILRAQSLAAALAGAFALAVMVNVVELLCTAGLPAVYTQVLVAHQLPAPAYYAYLALYNLAYMADDSLMVGAAVITLAKTRLQERGGRWLKLVSGAVVAVLGLLLLVAPDTLAW